MSPAQLSALMFFSILSLMASVSNTLSNQWDKSTDDDEKDVWYSTTPFIPVQGRSFGTIHIGRVMSIDFDFVFGGRTNDPYADRPEMFFRMGYDAAGGATCDVQRSAYPSFWLSSTADTLYFLGSDENGCSNIYNLNEYGTISVGISYHVHISLDDSAFLVNISSSDQLHWTKEWDRSPTLESHLGDEVPIWWMSDKFGPSMYNRANGTFSDIIIISRWFSYSSPSPTVDPPTAPTRTTKEPDTDHFIIPTDPTSIPTKSPSIAPSVIPTNKSSRFPTNMRMGTPTTFPTNAPSFSSVYAPTLYPTAVPSMTPTFTKLSDETVNEVNEPIGVFIVILVAIFCLGVIITIICYVLSTKIRHSCLVASRHKPGDYRQSARSTSYVEDQEQKTDSTCTNESQASPSPTPPSRAHII